MTEFLTTTGISNHLELIIKGADERLVIISPYLRTNTLIRELLEEKDRWKIDIRVIHGKEDLQPGERAWLDSLPSIRTSFCQNLHAKCYLNEKTALLTSMNLYEFSQANNREMGILASREADPDLYGKIYEEVQRIIRAGAEEKPRTPDATPWRRPETRNPTPTQTTPQPTAPPAATVPMALMGHCIRCRENIPLNPRQPYCKACFAKWKRFDNGSYTREELHCHQCGRNHRTTMPRPLCDTCFASSRTPAPKRN